MVGLGIKILEFINLVVPTVKYAEQNCPNLFKIILSTRNSDLKFSMLVCGRTTKSIGVE
jgi:hypothetical protein